MTTPTNPQNDFTPFLPSTYNVPEESDRLNDFVGKTFSELSDVINDKKIGAYTQDSENINGEDWIYDTTKKSRNGYQTIMRFTSFVSGTYPLPIIINPQLVITHVWGSASLPCTAVGIGDGRYFSFYGEGNTDIQFTMSDTEIVLTASAPMVDYSGFIVIEYLRDGI